jgi:hypothetical protein
MERHSEISALRQSEQTQEIGCRVFDAVAQFLASKVITPRVEQEAIDYALRRFEGLFSPHQIVRLTARQIGVEEERRRLAAQAPKPPRKDRFGRPIREPQAVLPLARTG